MVEHVLVQTGEGLGEEWGDEVGRPDTDGVAGLSRAELTVVLAKLSPNFAAKHGVAALEVLADSAPCVASADSINVASDL